MLTIAEDKALLLQYEEICEWICNLVFTIRCFVDVIDEREFKLEILVRVFAFLIEVDLCYV